MTTEQKSKMTAEQEALFGIFDEIVKDSENCKQASASMRQTIRKGMSPIHALAYYAKEENEITATGWHVAETVAVATVIGKLLFEGGKYIKDLISPIG